MTSMLSERNALRKAGLALYLAARWEPAPGSPPVNAKALWEALRMALQLPPGTAPGDSVGAKRKGAK